MVDCSCGNVTIFETQSSPTGNAGLGWGRIFIGWGVDGDGGIKGVAGWDGVGKPYPCVTIFFYK